MARIDADDVSAAKTDQDDGPEVVLPEPEDTEQPASDEGAGARREQPAADDDAGAAKQADGSQDGSSASGQDTKSGDSKRVQKRIDKLTWEANEAKRIAQQLANENQQLKSRYQQAEGAAMQHFGQNLDSRLAQARAKAQEAYDKGDSQTLVQAQEELADARAEYKNYERWLARQKQQQGQNRQQPQGQQQPVQAQQPAAAAQAQPQSGRGADKAAQWAQQRPWFGDTSTPRNQAMTATAYSLDAQLQEEGFDPADDDHWQELDKRMAEAFPGAGGTNNAQQPEQQQQTNGQANGSGGGQTVAGVSRSSGQGGRKRGQVRLTPGQVRMADKILSHLPKEQRYKEYAKQVKQE